VSLFFKILSKKSIKKLYILSRITYYLVYYFFPYRNKIITKNLVKVFPSKSKKNIKKIKKKFYQNLINVIFETIKLLDFNKKDMEKRVNIINPDVISIEKNKNIIIVSGHNCNWEWLLASICVFYKDVYAVYKPLKNIFFNNLILKIRKKFGAKMLKKTQASKFIIKNSKQKNIYFFLSDQVPENLNNVYQSSFLNLNTSFSTGFERLSKKNNAIVFYAKMNKKRKGYYNIEFIKLNNNNLTEEYVKKLEKNILEEPENWLWSHNRWKR